MSKRNTSHRYQISQKTSYWQTNFMQMRKKAVDYLKRHNQHEVWPPVDPKNTIPADSKLENLHENGPLSSIKVNKSHLFHQQEDIHQYLRKRQLLGMNEEDERLYKSNLLSFNTKTRQDPQETYTIEDDYHHVLPSICNLKLNQEEKKSFYERRAAVLRQKLEQQGKLILKPSIKSEEVDRHSHLKYRSIELRDYDGVIRLQRSKALSAFSKVMNKEMMRTYQHHDRNLSSLPVDRLIDYHKTAAQPHQSQVSNKAELNTSNIRNLPKKDPYLKIESESIKQSYFDHSLHLQALKDNKLITIYGIQPHKQQGNTQYKRFIPHILQHKRQIGIKHKSKYEKFDFSPWEKQAEESPNIADLQRQDP